MSARNSASSPVAVRNENPLSLIRQIFYDQPSDRTTHPADLPGHSTSEEHDDGIDWSDHRMGGQPKNPGPKI
jgi:hypothetical protein